MIKFNTTAQTVPNTRELPKIGCNTSGTPISAV
jgi:hypothetical protein